MSWESTSIRWRHARWSLRRHGDDIADIAFDGRVVLRGIRAVVRDRDWNTASVEVTEVVEDADGFTLHIRTTDLGAAIHGTLTLQAAGHTLSVTLDLVVARPFDTNRTGLVVLVPHRVAGGPLTVRHPDQTTEHGTFPKSISPHQPVFDIAGLAWSHDDTDVDLDFHGDVFEMEDQRNWSDASFKIYNRPLALPFPYRLDAGTQVCQEIRVSAQETGGTGTHHTSSAKANVVEPAELNLVAGDRFPDILLGATTAPDPQAAPARVGVGRVVELDLASRAWPAALDRAAAAGLPLDVRLVTIDGDTDALDRAAEALRGRELLRVAAFAPTGPARHVADASTIAALRAALDRAGVQTPIAGGVRSHFTELNRERHRIPPGLAGTEFALTPLFHSLDTAQLVESLAVQRIIARQAVAIATTPVHIGPITLRPHFNDVATTPPPRPANADLSQGYGPALLDADDPRQTADELAAWTIASAAALSVPGVSSLAFFEESGPRGICTSSGEALPVAAAVRALAALHGDLLFQDDDADGLVWAIGATANGVGSILAANLDTRAREVRVHALGRTHVLSLGPGAWDSAQV